MLNTSEGFISFAKGSVINYGECVCVGGGGGGVFPKRGQVKFYPSKTVSGGGGSFSHAEGGHNKFHTFLKGEGCKISDLRFSPLLLLLSPVLSITIDRSLRLLIV